MMPDRMVALRKQRHQFVTCGHIIVTYPSGIMNPADLFAHEPNTTNLAPGEYLFKAGDAPDGMFVLLEGSMVVMVGDKVLENSVRGAILGELACNVRVKRCYVAHGHRRRPRTLPARED